MVKCQDVYLIVRKAIDVVMCMYVSIHIIVYTLHIPLHTE